jgi:putative membrane protein
MLRLALAWLHLVALAIGFGAVYSRGRALTERPLTLRDVRRALIADSWWGIAALLWLATGLWRVFGSMEKPTNYYAHNSVFAIKMALFVLVLALEIRPMITLIKWRRSARDGWLPDEKSATRIKTISFIEAAILVLMVLAATAMARGYGSPTP